MDYNGDTKSLHYDIKYSSRIETEDRTKTITVMWTIPNFAILLDNYTISDFKTDKGDCAKNTDEETKFQLKIRFLGKENDLLELYYLPPVAMFLKSILTICLKCYKERSIILKEYQMIQPNKWQFLGVLFKREVLRHDGREIFMNEGSLNLKFQFIVNKDVKLNSDFVPKAQLSHDLENMLIHSTFSDVTIKSNQGDEFHSHKAILAARSAVLKAHFDHNTLESQTNIIESPFETEVLKEILTYIYTDDAPRVNEMPEKLLSAADFYQMSRLKQLCEDALHQNLTITNAIDTLELAELHSAANLKKMTLEFINDGHAKMITKTKSWAKLQSVSLMKTIFDFIVNNGQLEEDLR